MVNAIRASDDGEVYCVAARNAETLAKFADQFNIDVKHTDFDQLMSDSKVDIVYIGLPTYLHADWIRKCAHNG
jgi:predicted dehydrogenase